MSTTQHKRDSVTSEIVGFTTDVAIHDLASFYNEIHHQTLLDNKSTLLLVCSLVSGSLMGSGIQFPGSYSLRCFKMLITGSQFIIQIQMERVVVTQITQSSFRPSASFVGNRSFISTQFSSDVNYDELRKSRIQNLPNYKKLNLGDNLPFVVVFQSIEIQRLSAQIETNRVKIKEFERQIFNAQNYEVQIRQLTQKCFSLENQKCSYAQETEKLNMICHQLYTELEEWKRKYAEIDLTLKDKFEIQRAKNSQLLQQIERWKSRYMAAEKSKVKELDDLRQMMESQRKSMVDREIRQITIRFQTERGTLENQIRKLRQALDYKNRELEEYRGRCQKFQIALMESMRSEVTVTELENKLAMLTLQISRLTDLLKQKQAQIEEARQNEFKLNQQLKEQQQWEYENKQLKSNLENRLKQIEDWKIRCGKLDDQLSKNSQVSAMNHELANKITIAGREIERLNGALKGKLDEIESWKQKLARQQSETNRYRNLQPQINQYQNKIANLLTQIQRINGVLKGRLGEIEELKSRCSKMQITITNYSVVEGNNKNLQKQIEDQGRQINELKNKIGRYEMQITNLKMLEGRLVQADKKNGLLNGQTDRLNGLLRSKTQESQDFKIRHSKLESSLIQYKNIEAKVQEYEATIALLTQEIQRLNNMVRNKADQCERGNNKIRGLEDQINFLKSLQKKLQDNERTINTLNITVNEFKRNIQGEHDKIRNIEVRLRDSESNLINVNQQKDRVTREFKQKSFDLDDLKNKYARLEQEIHQLKEVQIALKQAKGKINMLQQQMERLERNKKEIQLQLQKERGLANELGLRVVVLSAEVERSQSCSGLRSKEFAKLTETFVSLENGCREKDNEILVLTQKCTNIQKQLVFVTSQLQRFLGLINAQEQKAQSLQQQVAQYQDYAKRIHILGAQIDRLVGQNKGLQDDISRLRLRYADNIAAETKHEQTCMQFVMMFVEIESLRSRLSEREVQVNQIRKSVLEPIRNLKANQ